MAYEILARSKDGKVEKLDSRESFDDATKCKVHWQGKVKPKFVYIKKI